MVKMILSIQALFYRCCHSSAMFEKEYADTRNAKEWKHFSQQVKRCQ